MVQKDKNFNDFIVGHETRTSLQTIGQVTAG